MTPMTPKSASSASSDSTDLEDDPDVAVVEMLMEPYFMQVGCGGLLLLPVRQGM
jgi:hypothetical protein